MFEQIIDGIKEQSDGEVVTLSLQKSDSNNKAQQWLANNNARQLIGLGLLATACGESHQRRQRDGWRGAFLRAECQVLAAHPTQKYCFVISMN